MISRSGLCARGDYPKGLQVSTSLQSVSCKEYAPSVHSNSCSANSERGFPLIGRTHTWDGSIVERSRCELNPSPVSKKRLREIAANKPTRMRVLSQ